MTSEKKIDNKSDEQLLIIQAAIDTNKKDYDKKMKKQDSKLDNLMAIMENTIDQIQILKSSPENMNQKAQDPTTMVRATN